MRKICVLVFALISLPALAEQEEPSIQDFFCSSVFYQGGEYTKAGETPLDLQADTIGQKDQYRLHATREDAPLIFAVDTSADFQRSDADANAYFQPFAPPSAPFAWEMPWDSTVLKTVDIVDHFANETFVAFPVSSPKPDRNDYASYLILIEENSGTFSRRIDIPLGTGKLLAAIDLQAYAGTKPNTFALLRLTTANSFIFSIIEIVPQSDDPKDYVHRTHFMEVLETSSPKSPGYQLGHLKLNNLHFLSVIDFEAKEARVFDLDAMDWDTNTLPF